jgi:uracil-DNA glycosylase family 4
MPIEGRICPEPVEGRRALRRMCIANQPLGAIGITPYASWNLLVQNRKNAHRSSRPSRASWAASRHYYQQQGISPLEFRCQHLQVCSKGNDRFVEAKGAFVGTEYEKGTLRPRLLFVSLDPGSSNSNPKQRTVESVRIQEEHECDVAKLPKARHWYRAHELAWILLKRIKPDLQLQDTHLYFAHVNSVKCCVSNDNHQSASPILFRNCQKYIDGEIAILKPDVLVTQGNKAREAIQQSYKIFETLNDKHICSYAWLFIEGKKVLWVHTYHPRNFGKFNQQRRECFEIWAQFIYDTFYV